MTGYEGSHQDWLEDRASDQLEREDYEAEIARRQALPLWEFSHGEGWIGFRLQQFGQPIARFSMDHDIAVNFAHAILAEVEIAQRETPSDLLDAHHEPVGVSDFGDDISDNCSACGFAVGFVDDRYGHDTQATVDDVKAWIARNDG